MLCKQFLSTVFCTGLGLRVKKTVGPIFGGGGSLPGQDLGHGRRWPRSAAPGQGAGDGSAVHGAVASIGPDHS